MTCRSPRFFSPLFASIVFLLLTLFALPSVVFAVCEKPQLLIVLDRSGSMGGSKWTYATRAINTITNNYNGKLDFGLELFTSSASIVYGIDRCIRDRNSCVSNLQSTLRRYSPGGGTNLISAITTAQSHLTSVRNADSVKNRKRSVMFITDGQASCANSQVSALRRALGTDVFVIGFGSGVSASCLSSMASAGGTGRYFQANNNNDLNTAMKAIADNTSAEICNNLDDDCDGSVDEGLRKSCSTVCGSGVRVCSRGSYGACSAPTPKTETCNNRDDDCDGRTDEGLTRTCRTACGSGRETCSRGSWINCTATKPVAERCDGRDNDCDGKVDENWSNKGGACSVGRGACTRKGTWVCNSAQTGVQCSARPGAPSSEKCDGIDNDCDGSTDENWSNKGQVCSVGTGACTRKGTWVCNAAKTGIQCTATPGSPRTEVCDGKDNDCDGSTDESLRRTCKTACGSGTETCSAGRWINCSAQKPVKETCNNRDDDCDGSIDEDWSNLGALCKVGKGVCERSGKWVCNSARTGVQCNATPGKGTREVCDGKDNDCDGRVDEDFSDLRSTCSVGTGTCKRVGKKVCKANGTGTECSVSPGQPVKEVCDGKDNDCDGQTDETLTRVCKNACERGTETCKAGAWVNCSARKPTAEICNSFDDDCDGKVDENWPNLGQLCNVGKGDCKRPGQWVCNAAKNGIQCDARPGTPRTEVCDGKDNDCDGKVDEDYTDLGSKCTGGTGACRQQGKKVCRKDGSGTECNAQGNAPKPEICNGLDDDCNGTVDEGLVQSCKNDCGTGKETCAAGKWEGCDAPKPQNEVCNNKDDDCDGQTDEGLKRECSTACGKGQEVCVAGKWGSCDAQKPQKEECNNKDDDCDGKTDEDLKPRKCSSDCGEGTAVCQNGQWTGCSGPKPEDEVCDGKDNDCDGSIDEKLIKSCSSDCGKGVVYCKNAAWTKCTAPKPQQEVCDSKDNDCDGTIDNNVKCPKGQVCQGGACRPFCSKGECPKGLQCKEGVCQGDLCKLRKCPNGEVCSAGKCYKPCDLVQCGAGKVCSKGVCVEDDCFVKGCPDKNDVCKAGQCVGNPCDGVTCSSGEFCKEGKCVSSCAGVKCQSDERCKEGKCVKRPEVTGDCKDVVCNKGEVCIKGKCVTNPCAGVQCGKGRVCKDGDCVGDPCLNIQCPDGEVCNEGDCFKPDDPGAGKPDGNNPGGEGDTDTDGGTTSPDRGSQKDSPGDVTDESGRPETSVTTSDKLRGNNGSSSDEAGDPLPAGCQCSSGLSSPWSLSWLVLLGFFCFRRRKRRV